MESGATAYSTIAASGQADLEVKRSRFVCTVQRVDSEESARDAIARIRTQHYEAGHHCSAMIVGPDRSIERSSDDGEPAGSAGAPMLEVLRSRGLSDVVAVVSRWFGGTKLGTGGLSRAYGEAVRAALEHATPVRRELIEEFVITVDHAHAGRLENDLRSRGIDIHATEYGDQARIHLGVLAGRRATVESTLAELTSGSIGLEATGTRWRDSAT
ncbi:MAG: YigZ family protein [Ornithinimicrobium sp.]